MPVNSTSPTLVCPRYVGLVKFTALGVTRPKSLSVQQTDPLSEIPYFRGIGRLGALHEGADHAADARLVLRAPIDVDVRKIYGSPRVRTGSGDGLRAVDSEQRAVYVPGAGFSKMDNPPRDLGRGADPSRGDLS